MSDEMRVLLMGYLDGELSPPGSERHRFDPAGGLHGDEPATGGEVPHADAAFSASRSGLLVAGMALGRSDLLAAGLHDRDTGSQRLGDRKGSFGKSFKLKHTHRAIPDDKLGTLQFFIEFFKGVRANI